MDDTRQPLSGIESFVANVGPSDVELVVAWLRKHAQEQWRNADEQDCLKDAAIAIERGDHRKIESDR